MVDGMMEQSYSPHGQDVQESEKGREAHSPLPGYTCTEWKTTHWATPLKACTNSPKCHAGDQTFKKTWALGGHSTSKLASAKVLFVVFYFRFY
jgi:hypothetical protein